MDFQTETLGKSEEISALFAETFSASEGADEGKVIGDLVTNLIKTTGREDLYVFSVRDHSGLVGSVLFSRISYAQDDRQVFILSPAAVRPDRKKQGIGQKLMNFALNKLREQRIDVVVTYGDPNYYSKVGFQQITVEIAKPPLKLSQPHGWLGQSLFQEKLEPLTGSSSCVSALNKPELW